MRFAGPQIYMDPTELPCGAADRFAGAIPAAHPELVDHIKASILPAEDGSYNNSLGAAAPSE
jgi:hypothetical protein